MMMIPIHVIAFFLATMLLPTGVTQFTIDVHSEPIQWTKQDTTWHAVELPRDDWGTYDVVEKVVIVRGEGKEWRTDLTKFLAFPLTTNLSAVSEIATAAESFGTPVHIKREKNKITLSQEQGSFFQAPATIIWAEPEKPAGRTTP